jgi:hypothetical protein
VGLRERGSGMRKLDIDLGLVLTTLVPDDVSDWEAVGAIFEAANGRGDPREGASALAAVGFAVADQVKANLANSCSPVGLTLSFEVCPKVKGDQRTPRQRSIEEEENPSFTGESVNP